MTEGEEVLAPREVAEGAGEVGRGAGGERMGVQTWERRWRITVQRSACNPIRILRFRSRGLRLSRLSSIPSVARP